jgi:hypothetical protein
VPKLIDYDTHRGAVVGALMELVAEGGLAAATLRGVARRSRVSSAALVEGWGGRDRMLGIAAHHFGRTWSDALWRRYDARGLAGLLPRDDEERGEARFWLAMCELARSNEHVRSSVEERRTEEPRMLDVMTGQTWSPTDLELLRTVLDGLRHSLCTPGPQMSPDQAVHLLETFLGGPRTLAPDPPGEAGRSVSA